MTESKPLCIFCHGPVTGGTAHWRCGGILPDNPRHAAISVAEHTVRLLTPKRVHNGAGKVVRGAAVVLSADELRDRLRPELLDAFQDGLDLALQAGAISPTAGGFKLAVKSKTRPVRDDGSDDGLFELSEMS